MIVQRRAGKLIGIALALVFLLLVSGSAAAQPLPGGTLNPTTIPKYATPLVIPLVMKKTGNADYYEIAVRQFYQQILPGGIWNTINGREDSFPATRVWSYGPASDPLPSVAPALHSQFNYPAYTIETNSNTPVNVRWRNELVAIDPSTGFPCDGTLCQLTYLPLIVPIDQTLHWANPTAIGGAMGETNRGIYDGGTNGATGAPAVLPGA